MTASIQNLVIGFDVIKSEVSLMKSINTMISCFGNLVRKGEIDRQRKEETEIHNDEIQDGQTSQRKGLYPQV